MTKIGKAIPLYSETFCLNLTQTASKSSETAYDTAETVYEVPKQPCDPSKTGCEYSITLCHASKTTWEVAKIVCEISKIVCDPSNHQRYLSKMDDDACKMSCASAAFACAAVNIKSY